MNGDRTWVLKSELEAALLVLTKLVNKEDACKNCVNTNELRSQKEALAKALNEEQLQRQELRDLNTKAESDLSDLQQERLRLSELLKESEEERQCLSRTLADEGQRDSKECVLRKTALALENENELLTNERDRLEEELFFTRRALQDQEIARREAEARERDLKIELEAKNQERGDFSERFQRLESEKLNVMRQFFAQESELEASKEVLARLRSERDAADKAREKVMASLEAEQEKWVNERLSHQEALQAIREGRKLVEEKLQRSLAKNQDLSQQVRISETVAMSLEESVRSVTREKSAEQRRTNELEHKIAEQTSLYEAKITEMQQELSFRLEEIEVNCEKETKAVKDRYIKLFNEKAEELHQTKEVLKKAEVQIADLQDREEEVQRFLHKTQSSLEDRFSSEIFTLQSEVSAAKEKAKMAEEALETARAQYDELQDSYRRSVQSLGTRLAEITELLQKHNEVEDDAVVEQAPLNILSDDSAVVIHKERKGTPGNSNDLKCSSSKKRRARKKKKVGRT